MTMTAGDPTGALRAAGLRVTGPRVAVYQALHGRPHTQADALLAPARARAGALSRQAVYDVLAVLVDAGLVRRIEPAGSAARYELRVGDNHHHLVCRRCGTTVDVDCTVGVAACLEPSDAAGFAVDEAEVVFWGLCPTCQSRATTPPAEPAPTPPAG